jgi:uncharacterized membrane protein
LILNDHFERALAVASASSTALLIAGLGAYFSAAGRSWADVLLYTGLGLLVATPFARVVAAAAAFLAARRWLDAGVACGVLLVLAAGAWLALG